MACRNEATNENGDMMKENTFQREKKLCLKIDSEILPVIWEDNDSIEELKNKADPSIVLNSSLYGGFERVCKLPFGIVSSDRRVKAAPGDIMLYQGTSMVLFYGENTWEYTKLGHVEMDILVLKDMLTKEDVTLELSII